MRKTLPVDGGEGGPGRASQKSSISKALLAVSRIVLKDAETIKELRLTKVKHIYGLGETRLCG